MSTRSRISASDFVVFLDVEWGNRYQKNRQHFLIKEIARKLEGKSKILAVERPICPWTTPFSKREKFVQWLRGKRGLRQVRSNLYVYTPIVFIHNLIAARIPGLTGLNRRMVGLLLRRVLKQIELCTNNLIVWIHHPYQLEDVGLVGEKLLLYDRHDDYFNEARGHRLADLKQRETAILKQADVVFVTSQQLMKKLQAQSKQAYLVPNGVDVDFFRYTMSPEIDNLTEVNSLSHPIIGFVGKITPRLDFGLLARLATRHPEWSFVLIGPEEDAVRLRKQATYTDFRKASNVYLLGAKPYESLPGYMKGCDVCIIPYILDQFNIGSSPLKLYEYLATGKPIVSTDLPTVRHFDGLVRIARDAKEFEWQVAEALEEKDEKLRQRRLTVAQENSWGKRSEEILEIIWGLMSQTKRDAKAVL